MRPGDDGQLTDHITAAVASPIHRIPSTGGVTVAVHDLGGEGPDVLLAHATGFHGLVWRALAHHLRGLHAVAPDLRGHGLSPAPAGLALDWDGFADDVLAVVDALGLHRPIGVGHSKGGAALLRAEIRRPGTFAGIWCFEPIVFPPDLARGRDGDNPLAQGALRRRRSFDSRAEAVANFSAKPPMQDFDPTVVEAYVEGGFRDEADGTVSLRCAPEVEAEVYRMGSRHDTFDHLPEITCPVVVAAGAVAPRSPASFAGRIAEAIPGARSARYDHLGHFGPLEAPGELGPDVAAFAHSLLDGTS